MSQTVNEKYINESALEHQCNENTRENPCKTTPTYSLTMIKEMSHLYFFFKGVDVIDDKVILEQIFDICTFSKQLSINIFMKLLYDQVKQNSNFVFGCPFKKVDSHIDCILS